MVYVYVAYKENGEIVKGKLAAASEEAATKLLGFAGYRVVNLKPFTSFISLDRLARYFYQVKTAEIVLFFRQLALLLESGINIVTALELLQGQISNKILKGVFAEVISDLRRGNQLSAALSRHPSVFSPIYCRSLAVGEQTGGLETVLRQVADYMEKEAISAKSIKSALMYPIITAIVAVVVIGILVAFVFPAFSGLYTSLGATLPPLTKMVIDAASMLRANGLYIMGALLIIGVAGFAYTKTPEGRYHLDKLTLAMPLLGPLNQLSQLARCCRSIALLFRAGLPLTDIMPLVVQGCNNTVMIKALTDVQQDMLKGEGLFKPMAKNSLFLPMMVQMVKVGEETGNLDTTLMAVAQSYEVEAEDRTHSLIELVQPALTLIIAIIVGFVALSLVSAMYSMYGQSF
ncbi:MAG: type II secretion system F family protein [Dehalococcoidales bacterium]|nr:type II secretion system F family protein [Dehalococcoidales bacterium]